MKDKRQQQLQGRSHGVGRRQPRQRASELSLVGSGSGPTGTGSSLASLGPPGRLPIDLPLPHVYREIHLVFLFLTGDEHGQQLGSWQSRLQPNQSTNRLTTPCAETRRRDECRLYPASQEAPLFALFLAVVVVVPAAVVTVIVIWVASLGPMLLPRRLPLVLPCYPPLIFLFLDPFLVVGSGN